MSIESYSFGRMVVDGKTYTNDLKIIDGKVVPEWWRNRGHAFSMDDLEDVIRAGPDILVLGTGNSGRARPESGLEKDLADKNIKMVAQPTSQALETFNELLRQGKNVAAGFHLTC